MSRTIVHIGAHKTGSSFVQHLLADNRETLAARGIDFPILSGGAAAKSHSVFANYFRGVLSEAETAQIRARIASGLSDAPVCILSAENFFHCDDPPAIRKVVGPDSCAVCYLREPVSHLMSMWKQSLKTKRFAYGFAESASWQVVALGRHRSYYCYDARMARWQDAFEDFRITLYAPAADPVESAAQFFELCGLTVRDQDIPIIPQPQNVALSDICSLLLLRLNEMAAAGTIPAAERDRLYDLIRRDDRRYSAAFADAVVREQVDMTAFHTAFGDANPVYAPRFSGPDMQIDLPVRLDLDDARLLGLLGNVAETVNNDQV